MPCKSGMANGKKYNVNVPLNAISGKTSRSKDLLPPPALNLFIPALSNSSALRILLSTFPSRGANCKVAILMMKGRGEIASNREGVVIPSTIFWVGLGGMERHYARS